jgi:hypothetical protein
MTDDGGDLEIDFGSAHGITDGSPVYWLPTLSPTSTNVHMPTGILYNKGPYFCDSTGTNTLKLCNDQAITDPIAFPSDFSRLTATGLTGGANNKLGSECYYFALSARFRLSSSRDGAEEDADIQTVTAQAARLMTRVCSLVSVGEGRVNVTMSSCRIENDGRPSPHGTVRAPITMIDNNGAEMLPTDWADPADATIYSCGMASLEGTAGNQIDLITTR